MPLSQISFGSLKQNKNEYNFERYYELKNSNYIPVNNNQISKQDTYAFSLNENFDVNTHKYQKKNKGKSKTKSVLIKSLAIGLAGFLGLNVFLNDGKDINSSNPNNLSDNDLKTLYNSGAIVDKLDGQSTKDYIITDTEQGKTADCWLLSTINSINLTPIGKEFFANMFEYKGDETVVHLFVGDYTITDDELKIGKVRKSKGDDDVLLVELAVEKALADYNAGKVQLPEAVITDELGGNGTFSTLNMGSQDAAVYILTGQSAQYVKIKDDPLLIDSWFNLFQTDQKEYTSLTAAIETGDTSYTNPKTNQNYFLRGHHAYCIKDIKDGYITITNPDNSSIEIEIDIDSFKNIFSSVTYAGLCDIA